MQPEWKKVGVLTKFEGTDKRPLGRWEENVRMNLKEIGINMRNWQEGGRKMLE